MHTLLQSMLVTLTVMLLLANQQLAAQDDAAEVADVPSQDLRVAGNEHQRYFLVGPHKPAAPGQTSAPPEQGYGLIVVLPGGVGGAEFHPFVKRIYKHAVPAGYLLAQPVAVQWTPRQEVVWPTEKGRVKEMKFTTEEFVAAVIADVAERHTLNPQRVFTLSWSSGGPAAYAISLGSEKVTGSLVAMSVFKPEQLPLRRAKGHAYFLYHSPDDRVCPYWMAERAAKELKRHGAAVQLKAYAGGHGWRGNLYNDIREGIEWLEQQNATVE